MPTTAPADEAQLPDIRSVAPDLTVQQRNKIVTIQR